MEDTHWGLANRSGISTPVLILVLMEDTHWVIFMMVNFCLIVGLNPCFNGRYSLSTMWNRLHWLCCVLILVLMEDTHWVGNSLNTIFYSGLNPCFNGRYSLSSLRVFCLQVFLASLNPCFNGRYSFRYDLPPVRTQTESLNPCFNGRYSLRSQFYEETERNCKS